MTHKYQEINVKGGVPIKAWVDGVDFDIKAQQQLRNAAMLPFIYKWIAAMPDVHVGIGATIGSVIPTKKAIIPAAVGVDIGCGMMAVKTSLNASQLPDHLRGVRDVIESCIPHGRTAGGGRNDRGAWSKLPKRVTSVWKGLGSRLQDIGDKHPAILKANHVNHLGTLGSGNHFVEMCLDEDNQVWLMLHSGSRGIGNRIGTYFISLAKRDMEDVLGRLPHRDLAYFNEGSPHFDDYVEALMWAQEYARHNREIMMANLIEGLQQSDLLPDFATDLMAVNCHHNYAAQETYDGQDVWITRKGAVRAGKGELGIIPGSMGARSFIVRGLGNEESFCTCSHGAGRVMSRTEAKKRFTVADQELATEGVECRKDAGVIDEIPMAYKPIEAVIKAQSDLIEVVHTLKQVVCVKG